MKVTHCKDIEELKKIPNKNGWYNVEKTGIVYFKNNDLTSCGGLPSIEYNSGDKYWHRNGVRHRINGPAVERHWGRTYYYLFGYECAERDYKEMIENLPLFYWKNRGLL